MDIFTKSARSRIMSSIKSKNTLPERKIFEELKGRGIRFRKHYTLACGTPDIAVPKTRKAVFIDGDFWHGFRFPLWKKRLSKHWRNKIERNRDRDRACHRVLRKEGWKILRIWEHQLNNDFDEIMDSIETFLKH